MSWCSISSYFGRKRSINTGSVWLVRHPRGIERRHLAEDARRRLQHGESQARATAFAEAEVEIEDGLETERGEHHGRGGLGRAVPREAEVHGTRDELRRRQERGAGDHAVDDDRDACRRATDHEPGKRRDLEPTQRRE